MAAAVFSQTPLTLRGFAIRAVTDTVVTARRNRRRPERCIILIFNTVLRHDDDDDDKCIADIVRPIHNTRIMSVRPMDG